MTPICSQCNYDAVYEEPSNEELGIECARGWKLATFWVGALAWAAFFYWAMVRLGLFLISKV